MKLSKNFSLEEFLISQTAERQGIDMTPDQGVIANISELVNTCMQPLRDSLGSTIYISSGYRPLVLNTLIGGSKLSAHVDGRAADFRAAGYSPAQVCERIRELGLLYDQNILEFWSWTHLGIARQPRKEDLTAYRRDGRVHYTFGLMPKSKLIEVAA